MTRTATLTRWALGLGMAGSAALAIGSAQAQNSQGPGQAPSADQMAQRRTTLDNSGDPTLALTPPLKGSGLAAKGSAAPNPDPHNLEGVWWLKGYEYMIGPAPGIEPPLISWVWPLVGR